MFPVIRIHSENKVSYNSIADKFLLQLFHFTYTLQASGRRNMKTESDSLYRTGQLTTVHHTEIGILFVHMYMYVYFQHARAHNLYIYTTPKQTYSKTDIHIAHYPFCTAETCLETTQLNDRTINEERNKVCFK